MIPDPLPTPGSYDFLVTCEKRMRGPLVPSDPVTCEAPLCGHKGWADVKLREFRLAARRTVCLCCVLGRSPVPNAGG